MPNTRDIKNRIKSVENIGQVTRALEAVSASRARKAQQQALNSRPYAQKAWEVLVNVASQSNGGTTLHPLLEVRPRVDNFCVLLITGDRGLAGTYNAGIIRKATQFADKHCQEEVNCSARWVTVGRKGRDALLRLGASVVAEFSSPPANLHIDAVRPIARTVIDEFLTGVVDQVFIAYTDYVNMLVQDPVVLNLLPLRPFAAQNQAVAEFVKREPTVTTQGREYLYEPSAQAILDEVLPRFTELQIYQAILESEASEHSARMIAMRNASENAEALAGDLRLTFNKVRQMAITSEILDIVGGVEALKGEANRIVDEMQRQFDSIDKFAAL
ncbi:MAG: ATP synthase F1 subunit gamma [Anaerolineae bacterium]|nr:ATP synthase F1 subunit gamma [Anaerolineae bacterium]